jgi:hypothetical protein
MCKRCGEPLDAHGDPVEPAVLEPAGGRGKTGRHGGRKIQLPATRRECPVVEVQRTRPDGSTYTAMVPRRLVPDDAA